LGFIFASSSEIGFFETTPMMPQHSGVYWGVSMKPERASEVKANFLSILLLSIIRYTLTETVDMLRNKIRTQLKQESSP